MSAHLRPREVPIATQAGKGFFRRQEVQDLISVVRAIADRRDTLALGALLRGPLVGLTEEEIADEILALQQATNKARPLYLWTDPGLIHHAVLKSTIETLPEPRAQGTTDHALPSPRRSGGRATGSPDPEGATFTWVRARPGKC